MARAETREALIDAALEAFAERGVAGAGMREIASRAGVATGLAYHYFADKAALLRAVVEERSFLPEIERLLATPEGSPRETLQQVGQGLLALMGARGPALGVLFAESLRDPEVRAIRDSAMGRGIEQLAVYLEGCVERGILRPHDTTAIAKGFLLGIAMHHFVPSPPVADLPAKLAEVLVGGLTP